MSSASKIFKTGSRRHGVHSHFTIIRNERLRSARITLIYVAVKIFFVYLEDRFDAVAETACTKINWFFVRLIVRPLFFIHNRTGIKGHSLVSRRIQIFAGCLGKPFRKLQFFFTKRRHFLAHIEELLLERLKSLAKIGNDFCWVPRADEVDDRCGGFQCAGDSVYRFHEGSSLVVGMVRAAKDTKERSPRLSNGGAA